MTEPTREAPSEHQKFTVSGELVELFMSFGMLNTLAVPIKSFDNLIEVDSEPDLRSFILHICLDKRDAKGRVTEEFDVFSISMSEAEAILSWVKEHLTDFFITRLKSKLAIQKLASQTINANL